MRPGILNTKTSDSETHLFGIQTLSLKNVETILIVNNMFCGIKLSVCFSGGCLQETLFPQLGCNSKECSVTKFDQSLDIRVLRLRE